MKNRMSLIQTQRAPTMSHSIIQREKQPTTSNLSMISNKSQLGVTQSKIKWKDIMKINIDLYSKTNSLAMINDNLTNIITSNITEEDVASVSEGNVAKLIKIYQHTIRILLLAKEHIEDSYALLRQQYNELNSNTIYADQSFQNSKEVIKTLKQKNKDNEKMISTCKAVISCLQKEKEKENNSNSKVEQSKAGDEEDETGKKFFCSYCTGKKYYTEGELKNHLLKRHLINAKESVANTTKSGNMSSPLEKENYELLDKQINGLKTHFENYFLRLKAEGSMMFLDNQRKIEENRQNKQLEYIESKFQETLNEIKEYYLRSTCAQPQPIIIQHQYINRDSENNHEMVSTIIKNEFCKLNNNIESLADCSQRINGVEMKADCTQRNIAMEKDENDGDANINQSESKEEKDQIKVKKDGGGDDIRNEYQKEIEEKEKSINDRRKAIDEAYEDINSDKESHDKDNANASQSDIMIIDESNIKQIDNQQSNGENNESASKNQPKIEIIEAKPSDQFVYREMSKDEVANQVIPQSKQESEAKDNNATNEIQNQDDIIPEEIMQQEEGLEVNEDEDKDNKQKEIKLKEKANIDNSQFSNAINKEDTSQQMQSSNNENIITNNKATDSLNNNTEDQKTTTSHMLNDINLQQ